MKEKVYVIPIDELGRGYFPEKRDSNGIMIFGGNVDYVAEDESSTISHYDFERRRLRQVVGNYTPIDIKYVLSAEVEEESIMGLSISPKEFDNIYPIYSAFDFPDIDNNEAQVEVKTRYVFYIWIKPFIYENIDTTNQHLVNITNNFPEYSSWREGSGKIRIIPLKECASRTVFSETGFCGWNHQYPLNLGLQGHSEKAIRNAANYVNYNKLENSELSERINMNFFSMDKAASGLISFEDS